MNKDICLKNIFASILFVVIGCAIFIGVQNLFVPDWIYPTYNETPADTFSEFYELPDETNIQAFFLGPSHALYGIDPMQIYKDSGVVTFNFATPVQPIDLSYYMAKEVFSVKKDNAPKYCLLDVTSLKYDQFNDAQNASFRYTLENMKFSSNFIELAKHYASLFREDKQNQYFLSTIFPITMYHDRWTELNVNDFVKPNRRNLFRKGYFMNTPVISTTNTVDEMNTVADQLNTEEGKLYTIIDDELQETGSDVYYAPSIPESNITYLQKLKKLCEENGSELILICVPSIGYPQLSASAWTKLWYNQVRELADKNGIVYYDMMYDTNLDIDWQNDTIDGGPHLNYGGSQKVSACLTSFLQSECGLSGYACEAYDKDMPFYIDLRRVADIETTKDLPTYLEQLAQMDNIVVFFSAYSDMMTGMNDECKTALNNYGLKTNFDNVGFRNSFVAVVDDQNSVYEAYGNRRITKNGTLSDGKKYTIISSSWLTSPISTITIDEKNFSLGSRGGNGLNVVVYDKISGGVIDYVSFTTGFPQNQTAIRDYETLLICLEKYERWLELQYE